MKKLLITIFTLSIMIGVATTTAQNQTIGLTIFPAIIEYPLQPADEVDGVLRIENTSDAPLPITIFARSLEPFDSVVNDAQQDKYDATSWISFESSEMLLPNGEVETINYRIDVPNDASPGGHYAQIVSRQLQTAQTERSQNAATVIPEISATLLITVSGDIDESLRFGSDLVINSRVAKGSNETISVDVINNGNVHILPTLSLNISKDAEPVSTVNFEPQLILPNTKKTYSTQWLADQDYGEYEVNASLIYGSENIELKLDPIKFEIVPPLWQIISLVGGAVLVFLLIIRWRHLPRAADVLRGRAAGVSGSYKRSAGQENLEEDSNRQNYHEIIKELERQKPILGLPDDDESLIQPSDSASQVKKASTEIEKSTRFVAKTQSIVDNKLDKDAFVSEELHPESQSKTVIIQTGSSTIVRQEQMPAEVETEPAKAKPISIKVVDEPNKKSSKSSPKKAKPKLKKAKPAKKKTKK